MTIMLEMSNPRSSTPLLLAYLCLVACVLAFSGCGTEDVEEGLLGEEGDTKIPLTVLEETGFLTFKAHLNDREIIMLLDTAANTTAFNMDLVQELELEAKEAHGHSYKMEGVLPLKVAYVKDFRVGKTSYSFDATFVDLSPANRGIELARDPLIEGLLGADFLTKWDAIIDYREMILIIRNP